MSSMIFRSISWMALRKSNISKHYHSAFYSIYSPNNRPATIWETTEQFPPEIFKNIFSC